jgi:hypothetical protein
VRHYLQLLTLLQLGGGIVFLDLVIGSKGLCPPRVEASMFPIDNRGNLPLLLLVIIGNEDVVNV